MDGYGGASRDGGGLRWRRRVGVAVCRRGPTVGVRLGWVELLVIVGMGRMRVVALRLFVGRCIIDRRATPSSDGGRGRRMRKERAVKWC